MNIRFCGRRVAALGIAASVVLVVGAPAAHGGTAQPDAMLRKDGSNAPFIGKGVINTTGLNQTIERSIAEGGRIRYEIKVKNTGSTACNIALGEKTFLPDGTWVRHYKKTSGKDITDKVLAGTFHPELDPGNSMRVILRIRHVSDGSGLVIDNRAKCLDTNEEDVVSSGTGV